MKADPPWRFAGLPCLAILAALSMAVSMAASPAAAQRQQTQAQGQGPTPNGDLWLTTAIALEYAIDARWSFHFDSQLQLDRNMSRLRDFQVRPGFEYALSPSWAVAAGYVQFQRYPAPLRTQRGSFQDLLHRGRLGPVAYTGRLRAEELFFENGALLVRTRALAGVRLPIGNSPWEFAISDEIFVNLKVDGTGRQAGAHQNRAYAGFGRPISPHMKMSAGYELDTFERNGAFRNVHQIRIGFAFRLN